MRMSTLTDHEAAARFRFGEFIFDCESRQLLRNGEDQHLSPKAQQLLRILLLNRPKAVSREQIYDALWPSTFVCETNMAGIVKELRRALGDDARSAQYIRTVHGFGYAFGVAVVKKQGFADESVAMLRCEGRRLLLYEGDNLVGRELDCDVVLNDATVSRHHAVIILRDNAMFLEDRESRNGTYVNGRKITRSKLMEQDQLTFGAARAVITLTTSETRPLPSYLPDLSHDSDNGLFPA